MSNWSQSTRSRSRMMSKPSWIVLVLAVLTLSACDDGVQKTYWENGKLKSELRYEHGKLNGESVWYAQNGNKQAQACYHNDSLEGLYQRWYLNGQLAEERWYKNGQQDSVSRSYSERGNLVSEDHYRRGRLNGESKKWYDNGQTFQEGQYVEGMMDGLWLVFYPSGALASKTNYKMGTGKQICYDETGYKCLEVPYVDNVKHGREIYYNPDGSVVKIVEYEHGGKVREEVDP